MRIAQANINSQKYQNKNSTISFKAMKKADFRGIDFAVVEKFKAPIERFNALIDFQNWAGNLVEKIINTNFLGGKAETVAQRKGMLKDWFNYVIEENGAYTKAIQLLILSAITKNLREKDDNLPPTLNKGVLADCINDLNNELEKDKKTLFDFNKMYQNKLRTYYLEDTKTGENGTKWVVIPSKEHDPKNFESNVEKLKTLSHKTWCTKSYNAEPYLKEGDFHVYLEDGEPKIGVRFIGDTIQEIQGELNNSKIPVKYFDIVNTYIKKHKLKFSKNAKNQFYEVKKTIKEINKIKQDIFKLTHETLFEKTLKVFGINSFDRNKTNDEKIYNYFGINVKKDKNGMLILSEYKQPNKYFNYKDYNINENELFKNVIEIEGNANFENSDLISLQNLEKINGNAFLTNCKITSLGHLKSIGGSAYLYDNHKITNLGNLKHIQGFAYIWGSKFKAIDLKKIEVGCEIWE